MPGLSRLLLCVFVRLKTCILILTHVLCYNLPNFWWCDIFLVTVYVKNNDNKIYWILPLPSTFFCLFIGQTIVCPIKVSKCHHAWDFVSVIVCFRNKLVFSDWTMARFINALSFSTKFDWIWHELDAQTDFDFFFSVKKLNLKVYTYLALWLKSKRPKL